MSVYPHVMDESQTLAAVLSGRSLARYGDGEFHLCEGRPAKAQVADPRLRQRLCDILHDSGECVVGIPNLHSETPKAVFWSQFASRAWLLANRPYASSFISRPDSAPWINTDAYWDQLASLWIDQDVTLVRGASSRALDPVDLRGARSVTDVLCPRRNAFASYDDILQRVGTPARALLCLGPTATVLAVDLCARGVHAIDLGHVGIFWRKHRNGEPMTLTQADRRAA